MDNLMTWDEYRRRHGYRDDDALRRSYEQNVMSAEGGQRFQDANPNWQELLGDRPDANPRFEDMSYRDFIGTRGGQSTARLGAMWRQNRGMRLTPDMQRALAGAATRASSTTPDLPTGGEGGRMQRFAPGGGGPASGPKPTPKPTGKPTDKPTFHNAPRAGTRVSPGSVPRRKRRGGGS